MLKFLIFYNRPNWLQNLLAWGFGIITIILNCSHCIFCNKQWLYTIWYVYNSQSVHRLDAAAILVGPILSAWAHGVVLERCALVYEAGWKFEDASSLSWPSNRTDQNLCSWIAFNPQ